MSAATAPADTATTPATTTIATPAVASAAATSPVSAAAASSIFGGTFDSPAPAKPTPAPSAVRPTTTTIAPKSTVAAKAAFSIVGAPKTAAKPIKMAARLPPKEMDDPVAGRTELLKVIRRIRRKCPSALEIMLTGLSGHGKSSTICDAVTAIQDESITTTAPAIATAYSGSSQVTKFAHRYTICGEGAPLPASSILDCDESDENPEDGEEEEEDTKDSKDSKTPSVASAAAKLKNKRDVEPSAIRLWDSRGLTLGSLTEQQKEREVQNLMYEGHIK